MTQLTPKQPVRRGRIFPERTLPPEELARRKAEREAFHKRCREIFERVRPELVQEYYGWYIAIVPDHDDYLIDKNIDTLHKKALEKYPSTKHCVFCLNEIGAVGTI